MKRRIYVLMLMTIIVTVLIGCTKEPPKCADEDTIKLVKQLIIDKINHNNQIQQQFGALNEKEIKAITEIIEIEYPLATDLNKDIKKYSCTGEAVAGGKYKAKIAYFSQIDDNNRHIVSLNILDYDLFEGVIESVKMIRAKQHTAEEWINKVKALRINGKYTDSKKATEYCSNAILVNPNYAESHFHMGNINAVLKNYDQSIKDYNEAIRLKPDYADAYNNRGATYDDLDNHNQAIADYNKAIQMEPKNSAAYNNRGVFHGNLGNHAQAIADFTKVIELDPQNASAYYNRGIAYERLGNKEESLNNIKEAARLGHEGAKRLLK